MYDGHWFGGGFMWIFWIALVLIVIWITKNITGNNSEKPKSAMDILKERYAKGEIDKEEYESKKQDLL